MPPKSKLRKSNLKNTNKPGVVASGPRPYKMPREDAVFIDAVQVRARYGGRSHMWLERLCERDPTFPKPVRVNRLRYWRLDAIEAWERETASRSATRAA